MEYFVLNVILLVVIKVSVISCGLGVDVGAPGGQKLPDFNCVKASGRDFAIIRGYRSYGIVDANATVNIKNALAAGLEVDVYLFPCVPCNNPKEQVDDLVKALIDLNYGRIWVDVEVYKWFSDLNKNREFVKDMLERIVFHGKKGGIYTPVGSYEKVVGKGWNYASQFPLWLGVWDDIDRIDYYQPFAGWYKPAIKQYSLWPNICGMRLNLNYYPD